MRNDTIAAVATPPGVGALAVVRMSGPQAGEVLARVFLPKGSEGCEKFPLPSHLMCYGDVLDAGLVIDEVMAVIMYGPRSYTTEDVAEIYCHGGSATVAGVLGALLANGARLAEPGEFTKRAFLNGRIDLSQAEAVMELINASTDFARRAVLRKLSGGLSYKVKSARDRILTWLAHIELSIDYPEHEEEAMNLERVAEEGAELVAELEALSATSVQGERVKFGVPTVIIGKPNVGKSSLMNAILREDRAIVTDLPGTTRDTLTEAVIIRNVPILLTDTAGIREGADLAEQMGVSRSVESAQSAELVLHVVDRSVPLTDEDLMVADMLDGQRKIVVLNKSDLPAAPDLPAAGSTGQRFRPVGSDDPGISGIVEVSAKTGEGLEDLYELVEEMFFSGLVSADGDIITQAWHKSLLDGAVGHLKAALLDIGGSVPEDIISIDLKAAYVLLGEMVGEAVGDDVVDRIFSEFCVGK